MNKVILTICSREKRDDKELLPAYKRYLGNHVVLAKTEAEKVKKDFYILSGLYGVISAGQKISFYDYFLEQDAVPSLTEKVKAQLKGFDIAEIEFYTKPNWETYNQVISDAAKSLGVKLNIVEVE